LGEANRAIEFYKKALAIAREIGDRTEEGRILSNLGAVYSSVGEAQQAIRFSEQALAIAREIGDQTEERRILINLGIIYSNMGEVWRAIELYKQARAITREIGDQSAEAFSLSNLGAAIQARKPPAEPADLRIQWINQGRRYEREQNWQAAIEAYQKARALFTPAEMTETERRQYLEINSRLAASLKQAQRWPEALALQKENFKTYQQLGDLKRQADTYMEIGHLNQLLDDYEEAWFHYLDAYRLYRRANAGQGDKLGMAAASEALGTLELFAYMLPQAIRDLEDARQLYHSMNLAGKATLVEEVLKRAQKDLQEREAVFSS
jgi:tetratricopeptide (TPR) repeat protein